MTNLIRLMTCGDVDNGKSTILGHLLYDNNLIYEDQKAKIKDNQYAHVLDGLSVEQEQNITVDVAYRYFNLGDKKFILADSPGHIQYTQNMATGASYSDLATVVIDATKGLTEQTKHHLDICSFMGITNFIFIINKMDLVDYSEIKFKELTNSINAYINIKNILIEQLYYIPISGLYGDNISSISANTSWYIGSSLLELLSNIEIVDNKVNNTQNIFLVQHVILHNNKRYLEGYLSQGSFSIGDDITILPSRQHTKIISLYKNDVEVETVDANQNCSILVAGDFDIARGSIIAGYTNSISMSNHFEADLILFKDIDFSKDYLFKNETNKVICSIKHSNYSINAINSVSIYLQHKLPLCEYSLDKALGHFMIIDIIGHEVVGYGTINKILNNSQTNNFTLWFTGLSGSGKTTLANALKNNYPEYNFILLDGDKLREGLTRDLSFSKADRIENNRRIAEVAKLLNDNGFNVIVSCISPYEECRQIARTILKDFYKEIYLNTPLEVCKQRDPKGLYKKNINNFTGISDIYEIPTNSDLEIDTVNNSIIDCLKNIKGILLDGYRSFN